MVSNFECAIGANTLKFQTGKLAQQANGSVVVSYGDCVLLVTATMSKPREGIDFFPLTIDFEEKLYARGKIPGNFFRREGRPSTDAVLTDRLTDRPIRPLFPKGFRNEVQVIITPLSSDQENPLDILTVIGASTALSISNIPFEGPLGTTRMGYANGEFIVNPTFEQLETSMLDLVVAGTRDGVLMMEAGASELPEAMVLEAIEIAQETNLEVIRVQEEAVRAVGKSKVNFDEDALPEGLEERMESTLGGRLESVLSSAAGNAEQERMLGALKSELVGALEGEYDEGDVGLAFRNTTDAAFRARILAGGPRPDGRGLKEIRPISCEVGLLPRTHGTGLFSRGETQVLSIATLGSVGDAQKLDTLSPGEIKRFMLHYNFPPYSVGEARRIGSPGRREIGHGALSERALSYVIPDQDEFPYTLRLVSEILSSNGSTSMGSVCAGTLALMDAGVPIKTPIAGISIGLVTGDNGEHVILTDIQGLEDHIGDMDFKVAGSEAGITAIQLDIKVKNISMTIIREALEQAKEARLFLLDRIKETIGQARTEMSPYAPRMIRISIPVEKIGMVIGPGGKTIRGIVEETGATVDVEDDGTVTIGSSDSKASDRATEMIKDLTREVKTGEIFTGKVVKITGFGAFVQILPGKDGMVHISELADYRVPSVEDVVSVGEEITVVVIDVDPTGRVRLSRRALLQGDGDGQGTQQPAPAASGGRSDRSGPPRGGDRPSYNRGPEGGDRGGPRSGGGPPGGQQGNPRPPRRRPSFR